MNAILENVTPPRLWGAKQIAEYLSVSPRTLSRLIQSGALPVVHVGRAVRCDPGALAARFRSGVPMPTTMPEAGPMP